MKVLNQLSVEIWISEGTSPVCHVIASCQAAMGNFIVFCLRHQDYEFLEKITCRTQGNMGSSSRLVISFIDK
jgi:hypothetical protein